MERALMEYRVGGIKTNLPFHRRVLRNADFRAGRYSTAFIETHKAELLRPLELSEQDQSAQADAQLTLDAALAAAAIFALESAPQPAAAGGASAPTSERSAWQRAVEKP
jgi:pyruvate carboxylase